MASLLAATLFKRSFRSVSTAGRISCTAEIRSYHGPHTAPLGSQISQKRSLSAAEAPQGRQFGLRLPTDPDAMAGVFGEVLAVKCAQKIAQAGKAHDELVPQIRLQEVA